MDALGPSIESNVRDTPRSPQRGVDEPPAPVPAPYRRTITPPSLHPDSQLTPLKSHPKVTMEWVLEHGVINPALTPNRAEISLEHGHGTVPHGWSDPMKYAETLKQDNGAIRGPNDPEQAAPPCDQCRKRGLECLGIGRSGRACDYCRRTKQRCSLAGTSTRKRASATTSSATKRRRVDAKGGAGRGEHSDVDELSYSEGESARAGGKPRESKKGEKQRPSSAPESDDWRVSKLPLLGGGAPGNGGYKARHSLNPNHDGGESDEGDEAAELSRTVESLRRAQSGLTSEFLPSQLMAMDDKLDEVLRGIGKWVGSVAEKLSQEDVREWLRVKSESQSNFRNWADNLGKS